MLCTLGMKPSSGWGGGGGGKALGCHNTRKYGSLFTRALGQSIVQTAPDESMTFLRINIIGLMRLVVSGYRKNTFHKPVL